MMPTFFSSNLSPDLAVVSVVLLIASLLLAKPWLIAAWGHIRMRRHMYLLHKQGAHILENIHFQDRKGNPVYIEYLILDSKITCLNSAAYSGSICGSLRDAMWCQQNNQENLRFENPLRQHAHICNALQGIVGKRIDIQAVTLFEHAIMNTPEHKNIITLKQLTSRFPINKTQKNKRHIEALTQLIQNISLREQTPPSIQHGNPSRLKTAQTLLLSSAASMLTALGLTLYNAF
ncbi:MAG: NERD domain-containing protein [Mariprofundaceae bacterium]|nr:NERD domain-containing protein [Mariprofundaceae bacterium]